jgi:hypothetical protein
MLRDAARIAVVGCIKYEAHACYSMAEVQLYIKLRWMRALAARLWLWPACAYVMRNAACARERTSWGGPRAAAADRWQGPPGATAALVLVRLRRSR